MLDYVSKKMEEGILLSLEGLILAEEEEGGRRRRRRLKRRRKRRRMTVQFVSARWTMRRRMKTTWFADCNAHTNSTAVAWRIGPALATARACRSRARLAADLWCLNEG